jgi:hypothetical protein
MPCFIFFFISPVSTPRASSSLASSRFSRAIFRLTAGKGPMLDDFSLPSNRYKPAADQTIKHSFPPVGDKKICSQPPPKRLSFLLVGFKFRIAASFMAIFGGISFREKFHSQKHP